MYVEQKIRDRNRQTICIKIMKKRKKNTPEHIHLQLTTQKEMKSKELKREGTT